MVLSNSTTIAVLVIPGIFYGIQMIFAWQMLGDIYHSSKHTAGKHELVCAQAGGIAMGINSLFDFLQRKSIAENQASFQFFLKKQIALFTGFGIVQFLQWNGIYHKMGIIQLLAMDGIMMLLALSKLFSGKKVKNVKKKN